MNKDKSLEKLLWSIALPGFGQILNGQITKGFLFIALEIIINIKSRLNLLIYYSLLGDTQIAVRQTNYEWLLFYPCLYMFTMWDALKYSKGEVSQFSYIPFFITAILSTVGLIYSPFLKIGGILLGPVWVMIICAVIGISAGVFLMKIIAKVKKQYRGTLP